MTALVDPAAVYDTLPPDKLVGKDREQSHHLFQAECNRLWREKSP